MNYNPSQSSHSSSLEPQIAEDLGFSEALVLIQPIATVTAGIDQQVKEVSEITGMDTYTVRQRLTGASVDILCAGNDKKHLQEVTLSLTKAGYQTAFIEKSDLAQSHTHKRAVAARLDSTNSNDNVNSITFLDMNGAELILWECNSPALIVAGSLASEQYGTSKALLATLYNGAAGVSAPNADSNKSLLVSISKQSPALFLIPESKSTPILIDATRFNYEFLGERRTLSLARNFLTLVEILQGNTQSNRTQLNTDFGQKKLPIGILSSKPKRQSDVIKMFALYAKLMSLAYQQGFFKSHPVCANTATKDVDVPSHLNFSSASNPDITTPLTLGVIPGITGALGNATKPHKTPPTIQDTTRQESDSILPPAPEGSKLHGDQINLAKLITLAQRLGPPPLIIGCFALSIALIATTIFQHGAISSFWSFLPIGIALCVASVTFAARKRAISNLPTSRIRSMPMGVVEVKGQAIRKYALKAPHSLVNCIYYSYRILERTTRSMASRGEAETWRVVSRGDSGRVPFYVEDETSKALVDPVGAILSGAQTSEYTASFADMISGIATRPNRRIIETVIPEGAELYVIGFASPNSKSPTERHDEYRERLKALKADPELLARYDANNDGVISFEEWAVAKADLDNQLFQEKLKTDTNTESVVIGKHPHSGVFYISDKEESDILSSYTWKIPALGIIGFALLVKGILGLMG